MTDVDMLLTKRHKLRKGILANLDLLMGSIVKAPSHSGYYLTDKTNGKTVTRYLRKSMLEKAGKMTLNHRRIRLMARQLSKVNWELLQHGAL